MSNLYAEDPERAQSLNNVTQFGRNSRHFLTTKIILSSQHIRVNRLILLVFPSSLASRDS